MDSARRGLNEAGLNYIAWLVRRRASGELLRERMRDLAVAEPDWAKNLDLVGRLRDEGYEGEADYLNGLLHGADVLASP
jgi:hypothetical protein